MSKSRHRRAKSHSAKPESEGFVDSRDLDERTIRYVKALADEYIAEFQTELDEEIDDIRALCKSPIERTMGVGMLFLDVGHGPITRAFLYKQLPPITPDGSVSIIPQHPIDTYVVDFLLVCNFADATIRFVVECDGHDYHERTKEQARHDKARDRHMTALGYQIFRFTGSEIHADPAKCVDELRSVIHTWAAAVLDTLMMRGRS